MAMKSHVKLNAENYAAARAQMMTLTADGGRPLAIMPNILLVPPQLEGAARTVVGNQLDGGGGTNPWYGTAEVIVCPWLI